MRRASLLACVVVAVAGCPSVDLGDTPADIGTCYPTKGEAYFEAAIWPSYLNNTKKSCVQSGCHDLNSTGGGTLHLSTMPPDLPANYRIVLPKLSCSLPSASPLYTKPCGFDFHKGGVIFNCPSDPEAQLFLAWFM